MTTFYSGATCAALLVVLAVSPSLHAQEGGVQAAVPMDEVSRITREVTQEVLSPYCPGKTLAMCPSGNAGEARREIQAMASTGISKEEIKDTLIERYGEEFRMHEAPPEDNFKLLGAISFGFVAAVMAIVVLGRRMQRDDGQDMQPEPNEKTLAEDELYLDELRDEYLD